MNILRNRWWVVATSVLGLATGAGSVYLSAFGVLLKPVSQDLGLGRGVFSFALFLVTAAQTVGCIILGRLLDRFGTRRVMIPGVVLYAASVAMLSTLTPSVAYIYIVFTIAGFIAALGSPVPYGAVIVAWFDRARGLALGVAIAGVGLGSVFVPPYVQYLIAHFGWRGAYLGLAVAVLVIAFFPVAYFLRDPPQASVPRAAENPSESMPGLSTADALRNGLFWLFIVVFACAAIAITGSITHLVPLLTDRGIPPAAAVGVMSASGLALTFGRFIGGWCLDHFWGPYVAVFFYACSLLGVVLMIFYGGSDFTLLLSGAVLIGLGFGAELDFLSFFASRYFGPREYAQKYGIMFPALGLGSGIGPTISGITFDQFHSYEPAFVGYACLLAIACLFFVRLGAYPYPAPSARDEFVGTSVRETLST